MWRRRMGNGIVLLCCLLVSCGNDLEFGTNQKDGLRIGKGNAPTLHFGAKTGGGQSGSRRVEETVVQGNIFNLRPATARPILVFVFVDLRDPGTFQDFRDAEVGVVEDNRSFTVSHLAAGDLTVVFLLDQVGVNQDGTIDPGDPIAVFQDTSGRLKSLSASTEVTLEDVDVSFNFSAPNAGIATVRSEGNIIVRQE